MHGLTTLHGRVVTLRGKILTDNGAQQMDAFDQIAALFATSRTQSLLVTEGERNISRQLTVAPVSLPEPQPVSDLVADVSITVESEGYPLLAQTQNTATITAAGTGLRNLGTYPADLAFTLTGPLTAPGFSWSGGAWAYGANLAAGKRLFVDATRRTVRDPDTTGHSRDKILGLGAGSWPVLAPGLTTFWRTGSGSGSISAAWRSAWS